MDEGPQSLLTRIIETHSPEIINERVRLENLLNDYFKSSYRKEKNTLVASLEEGIPSDLIKNHTSIPVPILVSQLEKRLTENRGISGDLAAWAVRAWALALHIAVEEPVSGPSREGLTATITVSSSPPGAELFLDGRSVGRTPLRLTDVEPGTHVIRCSLNGYQDQSITSAVQAFEDRHHSFALKPLEQRGQIDIRTTPSGCAIHLDAVYKGLAPLRLQDVSSGRHTIKCVHDGYDEKIVSAEVRPDTLQAIEITLDKVKRPVASLSIASRPSRATIFINNQKMGETPITVDLTKPGSISVVCVHPGYRTWQRNVDVRAGAPNSLSITLMSEQAETGNRAPLVPRPQAITFACMLAAVPSFFLVLAITTVFPVGLFGIWGFLAAYYLYRMDRRAKYVAGFWGSLALLFLLIIMIGGILEGLDLGSAVMAFVIISLPFVGLLAVLRKYGSYFVR